MSGKRVICQAGWIGNLAANVFSHLEGKRYSTGYGWDRCHRAATWRFSSGCVHEHVMTWVVCAQCAAALLRQWRENEGKEGAHCIRCKWADGHHCPVLVGAEEGLAPPSAAVRIREAVPA